MLPTVLLIAGSRSLREGLSRLGAPFVEVGSPDERVETAFDVGFCGRASDFHAIRHRFPDHPIVVCVPEADLGTALGLLRLGAADCVQNSVDSDELRLVLERCMARRRLRAQLRRLRSEPIGFEGLIGDSPQIQQVFQIVEKVAGSEMSVLIMGETGTGKELIARALHKGSGRVGRFVAVNCAAVPEALLESGLFGHTRGAFTDARTARRGLFLTAEKGTIFLDEIGDMPRALQAKLLRVLQERAITPVGSDDEVRIDVRVVAATHQNLETAVEEGSFREDLYYRLSALEVEIPPLRDRVGDVLLLADNFVREAANRSGREPPSLSRSVTHCLLEYPWPGNVRELKNCMERALALSEQADIEFDDLPRRLREYERSHVLVSATRPSELATMEEVERRYIRQVLDAVGGSRQAAARVLGFDRKTLYRKLKCYALDEGGPKQ